MVSASATLEQLVAESGWLRRLAVALVKDEAAADDLVQDTYSIAATQAPTDGRPLRPWLARVLWNRVRMASRSARRRRAREEAFGELAASPARPDEIVDRIEVQRMLAGFVLELAEPQRDVLLLHYFEGLTSNQIGQRLGISAGTVRWRLKQAIDELRDRLEQRSQNRAWVAPLAAFARTAPSGNVAWLPTLLIAAFVLLAIVGFTLRAQLGGAEWAAPIEPPAHATERPSALPTLDDGFQPGHASAALGSSEVFGAEKRRINGTVIDGMGQGVADAEVELDCGYADGGTLKQRTNIRGAFSFEIDPHCHYILTATKGDTRGQQIWNGPLAIGVGPGTRADHARFDPLDIARFRTTVQLRRLSMAVIRVVDAETGGPIANARISSGWFSDDGVSALTGPDGIARVNVELPSRITVNANRYVYATEVLKLEPGLGNRASILLAPGRHEVPAQVSLDVRLNRGTAVSGTVVGPDGEPVAGASVKLSGPAGGPSFVDAITKTDASGRFETNVPGAGRYGLSADRRDLMSHGTVAVDIPAEGRTNLVARLVRSGEVRGTVVDLSARPVAGARVSLADGAIPPVVADEQGRFVIEPLAGDVDIIAQRGSEASAFHRVEVKSGERAEVVLQIGATGLSGIAVDHDGAPVAGAEVWLNACCEANPNLVPGTRFTTDASGRFSFDTPRGDFVLSVRRFDDDDFEAEDDLKVTGGSHDIRLAVP
jgi:RNA polymerase sigma factor (sigma-70 family)